MLLKALLLGLLAGFAIWDGRVFGQHMFDRPIVTGPIVGLILGDVQTGIVMGASLELVMMGIVGIGAATPPDVVAGGILSTAFAIMSGLSMDTAVALSLPIATLAQSIGILDRTINTTFLHWADKAAQDGDADKIAKALWAGAFLFFLSEFAVVFFGVLLGSSTIASFINALPTFIIKGLTVASGMLPALGIAILMQLIFDKTNAAYLFVGFILTAVLGVSTVAVAVIGAIIAYVVYQTSIKHKKEMDALMAIISTGSNHDDLDGEL